VLPSNHEKSGRQVHERITLLMSLALDTMATPAEQLDQARHLIACPACAATWEELQSVDRWLAMTPPVAPARDLVAGVSRMLRPQAPVRSRSVWLPLGLMALGLLSQVTSCIAIAWLLWWGLRHPLDIAAALSSGAEALSKMSSTLAIAETLMKSLGASSSATALATCALASAAWLF
jgi:hypothetical protein